jgi:hypothetical protein
LNQGTHCAVASSTSLVPQGLRDLINLFAEADTNPPQNYFGDLQLIGTQSKIWAHFGPIELANHDEPNDRNLAV